MIDSFHSNLTINGNSHSPPHLDEVGAAGGGGEDGGGVRAEPAVAEIEMEAEDGPVAVDLPDIRNLSFFTVSVITYHIFIFQYLTTSQVIKS